MKIVKAIFNTYGLPLPLYILDPMPEPGSVEFANWTQNNQAAHTAFDNILGISGNDLTNLDVSKEDQIETWLRLHAEEHRQALEKLNFPD